MSPEDARHGTSAGYCAGCRDACCREAIADYGRNLRTRQYLAGGSLKVPALGTQRRIQALMALGWTTLNIDAELGRARTYTTALLCGEERIHRATAEQVAAVYERMSMRLPEHHPGTRPHIISRTRNLARRNGWPPPLAWNRIDDPLEQPMTDKEGRRTDDETAAEWAHFQAAGESIHACAKALGVSVGAIEKACERTRKAAA